MGGFVAPVAGREAICDWIDNSPAGDIAPIRKKVV
jgi:hypothetical protein